MNLNLIRPKKETEDLLLSITKNCGTLIEQTHRKEEETLEFKLTKPKKTFRFKPTLNLSHDSNWMNRLTSLEVYESIFNITEGINKFELYKYSKSGGNSCDKNRDDTEKDLENSDITATDLQNDIKGSKIIGEFRKEVSKRMEDGGQMNFLSKFYISRYRKLSQNRK